MSDLKKTNRALSEAVAHVAKKFVTPDDKKMPADKFKALADSIAERSGFDPDGKLGQYGPLKLYNDSQYRGMNIEKSYVYDSSSLEFKGRAFGVGIDVRPSGKGFDVIVRFYGYYENDNGQIKSNGKTFELKSDNPVLQKELANLRSKDFEVVSTY